MGRKMGKGKKIGIGILVVLVAIPIMVFFMYKNSLEAIDKGSRQEIEVEVKDGMASGDILDLLESKDLIKSKTFGKVYLKLHSPKNMQANTYVFTKSMNFEEIISAIEKGDYHYIKTNRFTLIEGSDYRMCAKAIASSLGISYDEIISKWTDRSYVESLMKDYWFITDDCLNPSIFCPLEGFLYPETYSVQDSEMNVDKITRMILDQEKKVLDEVKEQLEGSKLGVFGTIDLASVVISEASDNNEKPRIAGVFMNRLSKDMPLQSDVTVLYKSGKKRVDLYYSDLEEESPYNTYLHKGLPVGPICSPDIKTIKATLNYEKTDYLYFFATKDGEILYAKTGEEHEENVEKNKWY